MESCQKDGRVKAYGVIDDEWVGKCQLIKNGTKDYCVNEQPNADFPIAEPYTLTHYRIL